LFFSFTISTITPKKSLTACCGCFHSLAKCHCSLRVNIIVSQEFLWT
jgi:hypothetical protein